MEAQLSLTLKALDELDRQHEMSLIKLSEPLLSPPDDGKQYRSSSGAPSTGEYPTPASLAADLAHYKDLFTKLRFSYTEQVTKEKFLRNLVSDPPAHIDFESNLELEQSLGQLKISLQSQKAEVNALVSQLEVKSRSLAQRSNATDAQLTQLRDIPKAVMQLRADIDRMRTEQGIVNDIGESSRELSLGLEQTVGLVEDREEQLARLEEHLGTLAEEQEIKQRALKQAQDELKAAQKARDFTVRSAKEAQARKQGGKGRMDDFEERGRWLRGVESMMTSLLETEA